MRTQQLTADEFEAQLCKKSFWAFVRRFWETIIPEKPVWNWHIPYVCQEMQKVAERVFAGEPKAYDLVINVPPGSTKSTICSIMFPAWVWVNMPTARSICGSYSYPLALELSRRSRDVVLSDKFRRLYPNCPPLREDQHAKGYFLNEAGGYRFSTSTGGSVTGFHGHFLIIDDPLDPDQACSELEMKRANEWMTSTLSTRKVDKAISVQILIMQRLAEDDPTGRLLARVKKTHGAYPLRHVNLPACIHDDRDVQADRTISTHKKEVRPRSLAKFYKWGLLDPVRMNRKVLRESLHVLGEYGYAGQFLQRPVPLSGGIFKVVKLHIENDSPSLNRWIHRVRAWDKAGTAGSGAYTVGVLMGEDDSHRFWILDVIRAQVDTGEREELIRLAAGMDGHDVFVATEQEPGSAGKESTENTIRNLRGYSVAAIRPTGDKITRAIPFSSQVNSGNVYLKKAEWNQAYINELALFPNGKFKDQVDASSAAFTELNFPAGRIGVI